MMSSRSITISEALETLLHAEKDELIAELEILREEKVVLETQLKIKQWLVKVIKGVLDSEVTDPSSITQNIRRGVTNSVEIKNDAAEVAVTKGYKVIWERLYDYLLYSGPKGTGELAKVLNINPTQVCTELKRRRGRQFQKTSDGKWSAIDHKNQSQSE